MNRICWFDQTQPRIHLTFPPRNIISTPKTRLFVRH
ncbi:hypothetical protein NP493_229g03078 [Ridgeia piscesae]|uniref:Uncharacterized protein n=1 Tax=Ridgeia piscesae TaxID=27915 RepID=A0AAD9UDU0_RIDPI|nr:hypothetical protein NP493_229g03078 [Ridgeia piscesae]